MAKVTRRAKVGLEIEMFVLNDEGAIVYEAPKLLRAFKGSKAEEFVRPEIGKGVIEVGAVPKTSVRDTALAFLAMWREIAETAEKHGYHLLPLGAYPGRHTPVLTSKPWYRAKRVVLGKENVDKEASICGYHYHYTLPERIVEEEQIRVVPKSHAKDTFLNQYNLLVATDPVALTVNQSTPFWQGEHHAKDSRVLIYRDFALKDDKSIKGIHYYLPLFGALPNYEFTLEDLRVMADRRKTEWLKLLEQKKFKEMIQIVNVPALKFMWGPLRVNKIGTFEYRGPDMNFPTHIFGSAALLTLALDAVEKRGLRTRPSDLGITKPFLLEGDKIYLPPYSRVRYLEYMSTVSGLASEEVYDYCQRFLRLLEKIAPRSKKMKILDEVRRMLKERKTLADDMVELIRRNGYATDEPVPEDALRYLALYYARQLPASIAQAQRAFSEAE